MSLEHKERLLRKVKLNNGGGATIIWMDVFWDPENSRYVHNSDERTSDAGVHDDLQAAMNKLTDHLAIACEELAVDVKGNYGFDASLKGLEKFSVASLVLRGGEHKEDDDRDPLQVFIFGNKRLKSGHVMNFGTYGIKMNTPQEKYRFASQLDQHVAVVEQEALAYINGKIAPPAQQALDLEAAPVQGSMELGPAIGEAEEVPLD